MELSSRPRACFGITADGTKKRVPGSITQSVAHEIARIRSRYRSTIHLWMKTAYRISRNIGNVRPKPRDKPRDHDDNGNKIFVMTYSCTVIAPRDLHPPARL